MPILCENRLAIHCSDSTILQQVIQRVFSVNEAGQFVPDFNRLKPIPDFILNLPDNEIAWKSYYLLNENTDSELSERICCGYFRDFHYYLNGMGFTHFAAQNGWKIGEVIDHLDSHPELQTALGLDLNLGKRYIQANQFCGCLWTDYIQDYWGCRYNVEAHDCGELNTLPDGVEILFATVNTPPVRWFEMLCQQFPSIKFELQYLCQDNYLAGECYSNEKTEESGEMVQMHYAYDPDFMTQEIVHLTHLLGIEMDN